MKSIQNLYEDLFNAMMSGFAHCRAIYDSNGVMIDWVFIEVNTAFRLHSGILDDPTGKTISVVVPTLRERSPELFIRYDRVSRTGKSERFESYLPSLEKTFDVSVYSVDKNTFTIIFDDITETKSQVKKLTVANESIVLAFVTSLEYRDMGTRDHTLRVSDLSVQLGIRLGMNETELTTVRRGALLHDIGKIGISDVILGKPGKLTDAEMTIMKQHPQMGHDLLRTIPFLHGASDIPYCHHEKWDGSGYPRGLIGEEIPFISRMFSVVDVYDALTSDRPYRKAWSKKMAFDHIEHESGKSFDPVMVMAFVELMETNMLGA